MTWTSIQKVGKVPIRLYSYIIILLSTMGKYKKKMFKQFNKIQNWMFWTTTLNWGHLTKTKSHTVKSLVHLFMVLYTVIELAHHLNFWTCSSFQHSVYKAFTFSFMHWLPGKIAADAPWTRAFQALALSSFSPPAFCGGNTDILSYLNYIYRESLMGTQTVACVVLKQIILSCL